MKVPAALFIALLVLAGMGSSYADEGPLPRPEARFEVVFERSHFVPMRDGIRLAADLYFPSGVAPPLPVILMRTPYNKLGRGPVGDARFFAEQGYAVVVQDVRGKWESDGIYEFYSHDVADFNDTIDWIVGQEWADDKVGTYGCSYLGEIQVIQATAANPHHAAAIPQASAGGTGTAGGRYRFFSGVNGGAYELHQGLGWFPRAGIKYHPVAPPGLSRDEYLEMRRSFDLRPEYVEIDYAKAQWVLPLNAIMDFIGAPANDFNTYISTPLNSELWAAKGFLDDDDVIDVPALFINSWYDYGVADTLHQYDHFTRMARTDRHRREQRVIIGAGTHCASEEATAGTIVGERDVGDARLDFWSLYLRWFDYWLRDDRRALRDFPKVQYYLMGKNEWRATDRWPVPGTRFTAYYLSSELGANGLYGDGLLSRDLPAGGKGSDHYVYDPASPVPSLGGPLCCTASKEASPGSYDQREIEIRNDVLVYSTPSLEQGVEVTGPLKLVLYVSSDAPDTDFAAKLIDVYPDGRAFNVQEGILRARYREGFDRVVLMEEGEVYELSIDMQATGNWFGPGHRIRLEVASSNFPRFDRNLNTGGNNYDEIEFRRAQNTIHHSAEHPSHLLLPIVSAK